MPLIREQLEQGRSVRFSPRGTSMLPLLRQERDSVELSPLPEQLKKYDIILYRRENGAYVLHRIVQIDGKSLTCIGDNQFIVESNIPQKTAIAVVTAVYRGDRYLPVSSVFYRWYCIGWHQTRKLRKFLLKLVNFS